MRRIPLSELERTAQKPDHRRLGNWMARRVARPAALRVTWIVAPWGVSANAATLAAWAFALAAAAALGWGTPAGWLIAAACLQVWYLLDHVDGQLARLRGTDSLDGTQLDYLMHHTTHLLVPLGVGWGAFAATAEPLWMLAGLGLGLGLLLITLQHDARYKAFIRRLKRVRGRLLLRGGGGGRPEAQPPIPRRPLRLAAWTARKACEMHVVMNVLGALALGMWWADDATLLAGRVWLAAMCPTALGVAGWTLLGSQHRQEAEHEFAAWYEPPPDRALVFRDGWWHVERLEDAPSGQVEETAHLRQEEPS